MKWKLIQTKDSRPELHSVWWGPRDEAGIYFFVLSFFICTVGVEMVLISKGFVRIKCLEFSKHMLPVISAVSQLSPEFGPWRAWNSLPSLEGAEPVQITLGLLCALQWHR